VRQLQPFPRKVCGFCKPNNEHALAVLRQQGRRVNDLEVNMIAKVIAQNS